MRAAALLLVALLLTVPPAWAAPGFPEGVEAPLRVSAAVQIRRVQAVEDDQGAFRATLALRLIWRDPRAAFRPAVGEPARVELTGAAARERLARLWTPEVRIDNMIGSLQDAVEEEGVVLESTGEVQWFRLLTGEFEAPLDHADFPFDRQVLPLRLESSQESLHRLILVCEGKCRDYSGLRAEDPPGWRLSHFKLRPGTLRSWSGSLHSQLTVEVLARRDPEPYYAKLFLPLFAALVVPMLAIWLNRWDGRRLAIEAFEFMNLAVAGLFATIALNLAIDSAQPFLVGGNNLVARLFTLNYVLLGVAMAVILLFFRGQPGERPWPDPYVSRELFLALCWVLPLLTVVAVAALFWSSMSG